jgi:hypothetical protein
MSGLTSRFSAAASVAAIFAFGLTLQPLAARGKGVGQQVWRHQRRSCKSVMAFATGPRSLAVRLQRSARLVTLHGRAAHPGPVARSAPLKAASLRKQRRSGRRMDAGPSPGEARWRRAHMAAM